MDPTRLQTKDQLRHRLRRQCLDGLDQPFDRSTWWDRKSGGLGVRLAIVIRDWDNIHLEIDAPTAAVLGVAGPTENELARMFNATEGTAWLFVVWVLSIGPSAVAIGPLKILNHFAIRTSDQ